MLHFMWVVLSVKAWVKRQQYLRATGFCEAHHLDREERHKKLISTGYGYRNRFGDLMHLLVSFLIQGSNDRR